MECWSSAGLPVLTCFVFPRPAMQNMRLHLVPTDSSMPVSPYSCNDGKRQCGGVSLTAKKTMSPSIRGKDTANQKVVCCCSLQTTCENKHVCMCHA